MYIADDGEFDDDDDFGLLMLEEEPSLKIPVPQKCECGAEVTWGDKCKEWQHSTYCPLYRARSGK
jgi:hypothetical protein